ncbi:uncharacterized protein LOC100204111 isoform X1 [Hydra vulgaris]|uniref:uncharacterized protein LOC100204111 isoform X1 n=1 Tax=Hydra vulgaris TaxID=6087 RepID=UPI001F5FC8F5|nr:uncharacterized protein LOC100204111 [Hydra vulgaris]
MMLKNRQCILTICLVFIISKYEAQKLNPDEKAPNFTLPTLKGPLVYKGIGHPETNINPPIIFHEFTNHSGFLECLWTKDSSLLELIDNSPENAHYVFLSSSNNAAATAEWMRMRFEEILEKYYTLAKNLSTSVNKFANNIDVQAQRRSFESIIRKKTFNTMYPIPHRRIDRRSVENSLPKDVKPKILKKSHIQTKKWNWENYNKKHKISKSKEKNNYEDHLRLDSQSSQKRSIVAHVTREMNNDVDDSIESDDNALQERIEKILKRGRYKYISNWLDRLHFVTIPIYQVGNWLPLVMSRWYCSGHGCGLDQVSVETKEDGDVQFVSKRLDGRYDWLPSPYTLKTKHPKSKVAYFGNGCSANVEDFTNKVALVSRGGKCSYFKKMFNAQQAGAIGVIVYSTEDESLVDMICEGSECEEEMHTPGTMVPFETGEKLMKLLAKSEDIFVRFQHTPSRNFFVAIDEQGDLQEVGWLLYPSMIFLAYQAKWLNYKTNLLHNISSMNAVVLPVFNATIMQGNKGVVKSIKVPSLDELQKYQHVYLDMALGCPGTSDYTCPHWDHTVQLFICCNNTSELCGKEIGRWITPFRRRIGRWLTNIRPLIPLFNSEKCTFTMKTVPWAMPWKPSLTIRLADKIKGPTESPFKITPLFRGGRFDSSYSKRGKRAMNFTISPLTTKVKIYAVITGHGSDNNNCAEFCVTSHHFLVNNRHKNTRIFDTAGTATGCADRVSDGSEPNEHGTWLYGRDGWCDGENVSPWVEDITSQVRLGETNNIRYFGLFNGTDPNPKINPGNIIMYSYLVEYKTVD